MSKDMSDLFKATPKKQLEELLTLYQRKCLEEQGGAGERACFGFILIAHREDSDAKFCVYRDADEFAEDVMVFLGDDNFRVFDILHSRRNLLIIVEEIVW